MSSGIEPLLVEPHIVAVAQRGERRGVGGGAADAELLHALDQRRLGEARRRLGEMLGRVDLLARAGLAVLHRRQAAAFLVAVVVAAFLIELQKAGEADDLTGGAQIERARPGLRVDVDRGAFELGRLHLAGDGAGPDQLVEPRLIGLEMFRHLLGQARGVGRADGLMGFLRVLGLGRIFARRVGHEAVAIFLGDDLAHAGDRLGRHVDAVGSHISNETDRLAADIDAFIETLRDAHGDRRREAELARGLLLQRRGGEGRVGMALDRLGFDRPDGEGRGVERLLEVLGLFALADVEAGDLLAVGADEARDEGLAGLGLQMRDERPVFLRDEFLDFEFAVADEAQRHGLDAAGRARARQLAPQHRREGEADEIVESAAGEIGVDQRLIDLARMRHRLADGVLGDGVEDDALDLLVLEHLLLVQDLEQMPGNGLALAIRVGRENDLVGVLDRLSDVRDALRAAGVHLPDHGEIGRRDRPSRPWAAGRGHGP